MQGGGHELSGTAADAGGGCGRGLASAVGLHLVEAFHGNPAGPRPCAWHHEGVQVTAFPAAETGLIQWAAELLFPRPLG